MKGLCLIILLGCLSVTQALAQQAPVSKIHILNLMFFQTFDFRTTAYSQKLLQVKPKAWTVIPVSDDSLGIILADKPYFVHLIPGKNYFFVVQKSHDSRITVQEKTEMEFLLTASGINAKGPEEYSTLK